MASRGSNSCARGFYYLKSTGHCIVYCSKGDSFLTCTAVDSTVHAGYCYESDDAHFNITFQNSVSTFSMQANSLAAMKGTRVFPFDLLLCT